MIDIRIHNKTDKPSPSLTYLNIGESSGTIYRTLIKEDIPDNLKSVKLLLYFYTPTTSRKYDTIIDVFRPSEWSSTSVWKNISYYDVKGSLNGSNAFSSMTVKKSQKHGWISIDVSELAQAYSQGKYENTGFLLKARSEKSNYIAFYSSEAPNNKPKFEFELQVDPEPINCMTIGQDQTKKDLAGYYYCDPVSTTAEKIINQAIKEADDSLTIEKGTYKISSAILIRRSGLKLCGVSADDVLIQAINANVCNTSDVHSNGNITIDGVSDVIVSGLSFNHPTCTGRTDGKSNGCGDGTKNEQRACIRVQKSKNVHVQDCKVKFPIYLDFCYVSGGSKIYVHDNYADKTGHALVQFDAGVTEWEAYNNYCKIFCNAGIRSYNGKNGRIYNNTLLGGYGSGQACIELRGSGLADITITKNIMHDCKFSTQNFCIQCDGGASKSQVIAIDNVWWNAVGGFGQVSDEGNIKAEIGQITEEYWIKKGYGSTI